MDKDFSRTFRYRVDDTRSVPREMYILKIMDVIEGFHLSKQMSTPLT